MDSQVSLRIQPNIFVYESHEQQKIPESAHPPTSYIMNLEKLSEKKLLKLEEAFMFGYLGGAQLGAAFYNFVHHKALGISVFILGILLVNQPLQLVGLILFGHSGMDHMLGYGLKYSDSFEHAHLGMIRKSK